MTESLTEAGLEKESYKLPRHWTKKISDEKFLVTTHHGSWVILSREEFDLLRFGRLEEDQNLFNRLERECIIQTKTNENKIVEEYKKRYSPLFYGTSLHILVPTLRCNHKCVYCHALSRPMDSKNCDMDKKTAEKVVNFIFQTPSPAITIEFQGGEPLVNFPIIRYVVKKVKDLNEKHRKKMKFCVVSNFSLMDKEKMKFFIENNFNINTSLDGPKELHNKNRKYLDGDSYEETVKWIKKFKEKKYRRIGALPTISRHSLSYPREIVDEYIKQGFTHLRARPMNDTGFANKRWGDIGYSAEEFLDFWKKYIDYVMELNRGGRQVFDETIKLVLDKIIHKNYMTYTCWGSPCGAALQQSAYDQDGNIFTCDEARSMEIFKLGNVKEDSYKDVYCSSQALTILNISSQTSSLCDSCAFHPFCAPCPVSSYGSYGDPVSKLPMERLCKIRKTIMNYVFDRLASEDEKILRRWARGKGLSGNNI